MRRGSVIVKTILSYGRIRVQDAPSAGVLFLIEPVGRPNELGGHSPLAILGGGSLTLSENA